jgi:outer membrane biosynthesis protein TonB
MDKCITCGSELHPERAKKYNYCMSRECQEKNLKGLTMVAIGVNKAAEQYLILDENTTQDLASGKYRDQRRGYFGSLAPTPAPAKAQAPEKASATATAPAPATETTPAPAPATETTPAPAPATETTPAPAPAKAPSSARPGKPRPQTASRPKATPQPWTKSQQKLALLYNEQGLRPDEIAQKLGLSTYLVTQIILNTRSRGKL